MKTGKFIVKITFSFIVLMVLILLIPVSCTRDEYKDLDFVGMSKNEIQRKFGKPNEVKVYTRGDSPHIWGPLEGMYAQLKKGQKITVWRYHSSEGIKDLYFNYESDKVDQQFFWHHDHSMNPVFEAK